MTSRRIVMTVSACMALLLPCCPSQAAEIVYASAPPAAGGQKSRFSGKIELYGAKDKTGQKYVAVAPTLLVTSDPATGDTVISVRVLRVDDQACKAIQGAQCAQEGYDYYMERDVYIKNANEVSQWVTGILAVPFKFHAKDHETSAGATIGGYLGYESYSGISDISIAPAFAGGLALVPQKAATVPSGTSTAKATETPSEGTTLTGVSVALGLLGKAHSNFQFGVFVGADWVGKSKNYKYEGKPWISFSFGYKFSN